MRDGFPVPAAANGHAGRGQPSNVPRRCRKLPAHRLGSILHLALRQLFAARHFLKRNTLAQIVRNPIQNGILERFWGAGHRLESYHESLLVRKHTLH